MSYPSYINLFKSGELHKRVKKANKLLRSCCICPRKCKINRLKNIKGFCRVGLNPVVCSYMPHHGEEPPISGYRGSGTIFFSFCNMKCVYCQNYEFSQLGEGEEVEIELLAKYMLRLQNLECHNINLVTPTHIMPQILKALLLAVENGLNIPIVYNTGGYELKEIISILSGIVDIYLPDMRYGDTQSAEKYSVAPDYPKVNQEAVKEMHRQVGDAEFDEKGIIKKGLIVRHLVLPKNISNTEKIMAFIAKNISNNTYIGLMSQYLPYHKAYGFKEISRRITLEEYEEAKRILEKYGLNNGWIQESFGLKRFAGVNIKSNVIQE